MSSATTPEAENQRGMPASATVTMKFLSYWQCGTGIGGGDMDEVVQLDEEGLPFVHDKRLRGVLREAFDCLEKWKSGGSAQTPARMTAQLFGAANNGQSTAGADPSALLHLTSARLGVDDADSAIQFKAKLLRNLRSTAIGKRGAAKPKSLRNEEVAVPLTLTGRVSVVEHRIGECPHDWVDRLAQAASLVRELGKRRTRGRGRVVLEVTADRKEGVAAVTNVPASPLSSSALTGAQDIPVADATAIHLVWRALSPLVFSAHPATLGAHEGLRYLPGNKVTGPLAATLYRALGPVAADAVALGDACRLRAKAAELRIFSLDSSNDRKAV